MMNACRSLVFLNESAWSVLLTPLCERKELENQDLSLIAVPVNTIALSTCKLANAFIPLPLRLATRLTTETEALYTCFKRSTSSCFNLKFCV